MMQTTGALRYGVPDCTITPDDRAMYTPPPMASLTTVQCPLLDFDASSEITKGPAGLDVQGFTFIKHKSILQATTENDLPDKLLEDVYYPELEALMCDLTRAKVVKVIFTVFRYESADFNAQMSDYVARNSERGRLLEKPPSASIPIIRKGGRPAPLVHADYTPEGLRNAIRYSRRDIREAAEAAITAEDSGEVAPRYAVYSVWRPLKTIRRDPIAVCDYRSIDSHDLTEISMRVPGEVKSEYLLKGSFVTPPKDTSKHKWYWRPNMTAEDLLIIKLGDSLAATDSSVAEMAPHSAVRLDGTEDLEEPRASFDCRVIAFW